MWIRDSTVIRHDTVFVEVPKERQVEVMPVLDTLHLETSVAEMTAYVDTDNMLLRGSLTNKRTALQKEVEHRDRYITKDSIVIKEVPVEKIVKEKYVPKGIRITLAICIGLIGLLALLVVLRIYLKYFAK